MLYYFISFVYKYLKMQQQLISKDYIQMAPMPNNKNANINKIFGKIDNIITESQFNQLHIPINIKDENGDSILHHILRNSLNEEEALRKIIVIPNIKSLINVVDSKGRTPMHLICKYQYYNVFKFIVNDDYDLNEDQRIILNMFNNKNTLTEEVIDGINNFIDDTQRSMKNKPEELKIPNNDYKYECYNQFCNLYNKINNYIIEYTNKKNKADVNLEYILYIILYAIDNYRYITFETFKKIDDKQIINEKKNEEILINEYGQKYDFHMYNFILALALLRYDIFMLKEKYNSIINNGGIINGGNRTNIKINENSFIGGSKDNDDMLTKIGNLINTKIMIMISSMSKIIDTLLTNLNENKEILKTIIQQIEKNKDIRIKNILNNLDNLFNGTEHHFYKKNEKKSASFLWRFNNNLSIIKYGDDYKNINVKENDKKTYTRYYMFHDDNFNDYIKLKNYVNKLKDYVDKFKDVNKLKDVDELKKYINELNDYVNKKLKDCVDNFKDDDKLQYYYDKLKDYYDKLKYYVDNFKDDDKLEDCINKLKDYINKLKNDDKFKDYYDELKKYHDGLKDYVNDLKDYVDKIKNNDFENYYNELETYVNKFKDDDKLKDYYDELKDYYDELKKYINELKKYVDKFKDDELKVYYNGFKEYVDKFKDNDLEYYYNKLKEYVDNNSKDHDLEYYYNKLKDYNDKHLEEKILIDDEEIDNIKPHNKINNINNINYLIFDYKQKTPLNYLLHGVINNKSMIKIDKSSVYDENEYDKDGNIMYNNIIKDYIHITIDNNNINIRFINTDFIKDYINIIKNKIYLLYNTFVDNRRLEYFIDYRNNIIKNSNDYRFINKSNDIMNNIRIYLFKQLNDNILKKYLKENDKNVIDNNILMYNIYVLFLNKIGIKNNIYIFNVCKKQDIDGKKRDITVEDIKDTNIQKEINDINKIKDIKDINKNNKDIINDFIKNIKPNDSDDDNIFIDENIKNIKDIENLNNKDTKNKIIKIIKNKLIDIYIKKFKSKINNNVKSIINNIVDNELLKLYEDKKPLIIKALSSIN